jgi:uncharacterized BrkB/YihY/UPF0761 family membrane protein
VEQVGPALGGPGSHRQAGFSIKLEDSAPLIETGNCSYPISIIIFLLIYWVLPYGKVSLRRVLPAAIVVGITVELAKYVYLMVWPLLDFRRAYGPFFISVTLLIWGFIGAMIVLAGGELSSRRSRVR